MNSDGPLSLANQKTNNLSKIGCFSLNCRFFRFRFSKMSVLPQFLMVILTFPWLLRIRSMKKPRKSKRKNQYKKSCNRFCGIFESQNLHDIVWISPPAMIQLLVNYELCYGASVGLQRKIWNVDVEYHTEKFSHVSNVGIVRISATVRDFVDQLYNVPKQSFSVILSKKINNDFNSLH
jgi:hypothetical protein